MIGFLRTRVRKQPTIALYFESGTVLKFYNLEARFNGVFAGRLGHCVGFIMHWSIIHVYEENNQSKILNIKLTQI